MSCVLEINKVINKYDKQGVHKRKHPKVVLEEGHKNIMDGKNTY